jgi:beta-phosphoglucomutase-like phosphatase (HAD superfamily)
LGRVVPPWERAGNRPSPPRHPAGAAHAASGPTRPCRPPTGRSRGNQTARAEQLLRGLDLAADWIGTSVGWGVEKPAPAFFAKVISESGYPPEQVAYVGDRLDNDVLPALAAGMVAVFLRRGPWGYIHARHPDAQRAALAIRSLEELPQLLEPIRDALCQALHPKGD